MEPADRLAAFLAGELRADERAELEAALTRDPELRRMLAAMRRADEALTGLRSPRPGAGFDERLDRELDAVLAETLPDEGAPTGAPGAPIGGSTAASSTVAPGTDAGDELAARRRRRGNRTGLIGAAAAGIVLLAGGALVSQLGGADDDTTAETALDTGDEAAGEDQDAMMEGAGPDGPTVLASDRDLDEADLDALLEDEELANLSTQRLDGGSGGDLARSYQEQLGVAETPAASPDEDVSPTEEDAPTDDADEDADVPEADDGAQDTDVDSAEDADEEAADEPSLDVQQLPDVTTRDGRPLDDDAVADLARCLDELLEGGDEAIPVYAELATFDGQDAVVFGLVTLQADTGEYTRREIWAMERGTCQVLRFSQAAADGS